MHEKLGHFCLQKDPEKTSKMLGGQNFLVVVKRVWVPGLHLPSPMVPWMEKVRSSVVKSLKGGREHHASARRVFPGF